MTLNFSTPAQSIVCIDLLNSTWDKIYASALACNFPDFLFDFLKIKFNDLHSEQRNSESISKIYFEDAYIVSSTSLSSNNEIQDFTYYINYELNEIKPISNNSDSKKIMELLIGNFSKNGNLTLDEIENEALSQINKDINTKPFFAFEREIINLEVNSEIQLTAEELYTRYNIKVVFQEYYSKLKTHRFKLSSIYYRNQLPIAFSFRYYGKTYIAWNEEYITSILSIEPINIISFSKTEQLNKILDKINEVGLINLTKPEMNFMDTY